MGSAIAMSDAVDPATFWPLASKHILYTGVPPSPFIITKTKGTRLYDSTGRPILDFTSGQMSSLIGHAHPEIAAVINHHAANLDHLLSNMLTQPVLDLAQALASLLPAPLTKSFFLSTGSESTEAAIRLAQTYTGRFEIVAFSASYHGLTAGAAAATYSTGRRAGIPSAPGHIAFPAPYALPVAVPLRRRTYDWRAELDYGWSLVDSSRSGRWRPFIFEPILSTGASSTCRRVLEIVRRDGLCAAAEARGRQLREGLLRLKDKYWCVGDVRGKGLLQGIEIISDAETKAPGSELGQAVSERAMDRGLSCNVVNLPGMGGVFRLAPPVTVTEDEIAEGLAILDEAFEYVLKQQKKP
ncbi:2,2-dialkylglycine decarboxylase [Verticillium alfalfae VaMs.102]|uniref:2,2-dialkylglycine decarboxylase n=1 Tax=Verticillium alfalfae (strain VaMs.102 / ATCC MYA-4576 / FGSC 10136) TaxID=526221 RepID=C9SWX1_VERA1|nr:2,2-dialkylglycine decarboxylase [Verticillium alfalfae VaMs.102]EEY23512.1 2,2-dialkylglycine decarboxylase [Verticillium alfalfae VaMs.102]